MADSVTMPTTHYMKIMKKAGEVARKSTEAVFGFGVSNKQALMTVVGAGFGWYILSNKSWSDKISLFKEHWWLKSLLVLAVGWYLWRKKNPYATIVLAIGAALFAQAWRNEQNKKPGAKIEETGDVEWDAANGRWVKSATGGEVLMSPGTDQSEQFARSVFNQAGGRAAA